MQINPYVKLLGAIFLFGSSGVFVKNLQLPPTTLTFFRMAVPTVTLFLFFLYRRQKFVKQHKKVLVFISVINALRLLLFMMGYTYTTIANAIIIFYSWPIFAMLFSILLLKEPIIKQNMALLALPFAGIVLIFYDKEFSFQNQDFLGMMAMLSAAVINAFSVVIFKKLSAFYTKFESVFYQNAAGVFIFMPFLWLNAQFPSPTQLGVLVIFGLLIGLGAFALFFSALKQVKASNASFLAYIEVLVAVGFGVLVFDETLTWNMLVGGALVIISTILLKKT